MATGGVAEIADRAGLTERTYFRHYADKREALFAGRSGLSGLIVQSASVLRADTPQMKPRHTRLAK